MSFCLDQDAQRSRRRLNKWKTKQSLHVLFSCFNQFTLNPAPSPLKHTYTQPSHLWTTQDLIQHPRQSHRAKRKSSSCHFTHNNVSSTLHRAKADAFLYSHCIFIRSTHSKTLGIWTDLRKQISFKHKLLHKKKQKTASSKARNVQVSESWWIGVDLYMFTLPVYDRYSFQCKCFIFLLFAYMRQCTMRQCTTCSFFTASWFSCTV